MGKEAAEKSETPPLNPVCRTLVRLANNTCTAREPCKCPTNGMQVSLSRSQPFLPVKFSSFGFHIEIVWSAGNVFFGSLSNNAYICREFRCLGCCEATLCL